MSTKTLKWMDDEDTQNKARKYCPIGQRKKPAKQYEWFSLCKKTWDKDDRVIHPSKWPDTLRLLGPQHIITEFKNQRYTHGLCMVVLWGNMKRTVKYIWYDHSPGYIEKILHDCSKEIQSSHSIESSWLQLTEELGWSDVITSKTLHFMCRSAGFHKNPPVPIDKAVIMEKVWREWKERQGVSGSWRNATHTFYCYTRYITAIRTWALKKKWTTTEVEATIYDKFKRPLP